MHRVAILAYPLLCCLLLAAPRAAARAQSPPAFAGGWLAVARNSPFLTRAGTAQRDFYALTLRAGRAIGSFPGVTLYYTADVLPIVATTNNVNGFDVRPCPGVPSGCLVTLLRTGTVYGAGFSPLGLSAAMGSFSSVSFQLQLSGGAIWFSRPVPDPEAQRFNFTATAGAAVEVALGAGYAAVIGYMRHHMSNAGIARVNPGLDAHVFYLGMNRRRPRPERPASPARDSTARLYRTRR